jgi:probable rRNA maturation factor
MTLYYEDEYGKEWPFDPKILSESVIEASLDYEACPYETQVNLLLTGNEEIQEMNRNFREIDRPTDVLSFPLVEYDVPSDFSRAEKEETDCFDPESGELMLGDIVISGDKVREQAENYGHSVKREFAFLVAHSMLHLLGYDHMTEEDAAEMEKRQEEILSGLSITR